MCSCPLICLCLIEFNLICIVGSWTWGFLSNFLTRINVVCSILLRSKKHRRSAGYLMYSKNSFKRRLQGLPFLNNMKRVSMLTVFTFCTTEVGPRLVSPLVFWQNCAVVMVNILLVFLNWHKLSPKPFCKTKEWHRSFPYRIHQSTCSIKDPKWVWLLAQNEEQLLIP